MNISTHQVYLSYAWGGESEKLVNQLDTQLQARGITLVRDKRDLGYKGRIREFMEEIGRGHAVVVVVSDKYLRSENCMKELVEIARHSDIHDRIFPVVMPDADIFKSINCIKYVKHWEDEFKALSDAMGTVNPANLQGLRDSIDDYDSFRDHISRLAFMFRNMNTLTPDMHEQSGFAALATALEARLKEAVPTPAAAAAAAAPLAAPAQPAAAAALDASRYLASLGERLTKAGYEALNGERFGELRFKPAYNKLDKGFIADDHHRVLVLTEPRLNPGRLATLQTELQQYVNEFVDRNTCNLYLIGVLITGAVPADVQQALFQTPPPSEDLVTDGKMLMLALYSVPDDELLFPKAIPEGLDAEFEAKIKDFLTP